ncbi:MAG: nucleoside deaminase [Clostridiales bacterium]|nr:nucleoside deaminase [Clostridiales bacterium]
MTHEDYMREALALAREAAGAGDVPVGCVVVWEGAIVGRGRNRREEAGDAVAHAEVEAIRAACGALGGWRLHKARLYVTLEPCPMCAGAIINARIPEVYYGARDGRAGACGSVLNLFEEGFHHKPKLVGGVLEGPCTEVLQQFFQCLRKKNEI